MSKPEVPMPITAPIECSHTRMADVAELVENPRNPNKHSASQIELLAKIIANQGWRSPIVVSKRSGFIVKGHGRYQAALKLGLDQVPIDEQEYESEAKEWADLIADNRLAELAEINRGELKDLLGDLDDGAFDMDLTGFLEDDLADLMSEFAPENEGLTDEDAVPEVPEEPTSKLGQIWKLGNHRLMCGDSTDKEQVAKLCDSQLVDMWLTDPPYNVNYEGGTGLTIKNDDMDNDSFRLFLKDAYSAASESMKEGAVFYIWHADSEGYNFRGAASDVGWKVRQCLIWKKSSLVMGRQDYHWKHEPCLYGWKEGAGHLWATDRKQTTILEFDKPSKSVEHPTMKPVELFAYQMLNNTKGSDVVLDSFGGSGTTMIACEIHGRHSRLMEFDPKYCDVIIRRWEEFTGEQAELIEEVQEALA